MEDVITIISQPVMSAILGAVAGAGATFIPTALIEQRKTNRLKNNIKRIVRIELEEIQNVVNICLEGEKKDDKIFVKDKSETGTRIYDVMKFRDIDNLHYYVFEPKNYPSLSGEIKANVFEESIDSLEYTYRKIHEFKLLRSDVPLEPYYFDEIQGMNLLESLTMSISKLG